MQVSDNIQLVLVGHPARTSVSELRGIFVLQVSHHILLCKSSLKTLEATVPRDNSEVEERSYSKIFFWDILYLLNSIKIKWSYSWNTRVWKKCRSRAEKSETLVKELTKSHICLLFLLLRCSALAPFMLVLSLNPECKHKFQAVGNSTQLKSAWQQKSIIKPDPCPQCGFFQSLSC